MMYRYTTKGVCSRAIEIEIEDGIVTFVRFEGGCNGNGKGVAALAMGRPIDDVIKAVRGITCGMKSTSCPDQLAQALEEIRAQ